MVELRAAVAKKKPLILVLEMDANHGGVPLDVHREECPEELREAVFSAPIIPWHRLKDFQICSMRLLVEQLLTAWDLPGNEQSIFIPADILRTPLPHLASSKPFHACVSPNNVGAADVAVQLQLASTRQAETRQAEPRSSAASAVQRVKTWSERSGSVSLRSASVSRRSASVSLSADRLRISDSSTHDFSDAMYFLVYLNDQTFNSGASSDYLSDEILRVLDAHVALLLVHEQRTECGGVSFPKIIESTPGVLLARGIYRSIATPLHAEPHAAVSLRLLLDQIDTVPYRLHRRPTLARLAGWQRARWVQPKPNLSLYYVRRRAGSSTKLAI